jgi:hypothetical protein
MQALRSSAPDYTKKIGVLKIIFKKGSIAVSYEKIKSTK